MSSELIQEFMKSFSNNDQTTFLAGNVSKYKMGSQTLENTISEKLTNHESHLFEKNKRFCPRVDCSLTNGNIPLHNENKNTVNSLKVDVKENWTITPKNKTKGKLKKPSAPKMILIRPKFRSYSFRFKTNMCQTFHCRSAYADMLHDTERNQLYYQGLKKAIDLMHSRGLKANVLDIGTGTGLLSMMAVKCGADSVTACEAFNPMAECAKHVMKDNHVGDKIKLILKRSTEITVGPDGDMPERANILVTEVFDTELIGEGAIGTFSHAHKCLLQEDCYVVPRAANMYVQIVQSDVVRSWHQFQPIKIADSDDVIPPKSTEECTGAAAVHDIQMDQLKQDQFKPITEPIKIFRFDYTGKGEINFSGEKLIKTTAKQSGATDAVFMWWDIEMDPEGEILLSCAPGWAHPTPKNMQWRDHWMQAVYYPKKRLEVKEGDSLAVIGSHDEYSLWFDVQTEDKCNGTDQIKSEHPVCKCGSHVACSRPRVGLINDAERNKKYVNALKKVLTKDSVCMCLSDGSLLPLIAARLGAKKVYCIETNPIARRMVQNFVDANKLSDKIIVLAKRAEDLTADDLDQQKVDTLIGEPYFYSSMLPWHNIYFWYSRTDMFKQLVEHPTIVPRGATLKAIGVEFKDLWKIRAPVQVCEGFNLQIFDKMIDRAADITDCAVEPQPLWEYPGKPLTDQIKLMHLDFTKALAGLKTVDRTGVVNFQTSGVCNGVAIWMDFHLDSENTVYTGLLSPPKTGENLEWDMNTRQGVHLIKVPLRVEGGKKEHRLKYKVLFKPKTGEIDFKFAILR